MALRGGRSSPVKRSGASSPQERFRNLSLRSVNCVEFTHTLLSVWTRIRVKAFAQLQSPGVGVWGRLPTFHQVCWWDYAEPTKIFGLLEVRTHLFLLRSAAYSDCCFQSRIIHVLNRDFVSWHLRTFLVIFLHRASHGRIRNTADRHVHKVTKNELASFLWLLY